MNKLKKKRKKKKEKTKADAKLGCAYRSHCNQNYSGTPVTRTLKGNKKLFELEGFRVIGVD